MRLLRSAAPLHDQVRWDLYERVRSGEFSAGDAIPNEADLCAQYGVSRITVRRAVGDLCAENILYRRHGVGTFVADPVAAAQSIRLRGNLGDLLAEDPRIRFRLVAWTAIGRGDRAAALFGNGTDLVRIDCLVRIDGDPFAVAEFFLPEADAAKLKRRDFSGTRQPILTVAERLERPLLRAEQVLTATAIDADLGQQLGVPPNSPSMMMTRTYFDTENRILAHVVGRFHPARFRVQVALQFGSQDSARLLGTRSSSVASAAGR